MMAHAYFVVAGDIGSFFLSPHLTASRSMYMYSLHGTCRARYVMKGRSRDDPNLDQAMLLA